MNDGSNQAGLLFFFVFPTVGYEGCIGLDGSEFMSAAAPIERGIAHELSFLVASIKSSTTVRKLHLPPQLGNLL